MTSRKIKELPPMGNIPIEACTRLAIENHQLNRFEQATVGKIVEQYNAMHRPETPPETLLEAWRDFQNAWRALAIEPLLNRLTRVVMWMTQLLRKVLQ